MNYLESHNTMEIFDDPHSQTTHINIYSPREEKIYEGGAHKLSFNQFIKYYKETCETFGINEWEVEYYGPQDTELGKYFTNIAYKYYEKEITNHD